MESACVWSSPYRPQRAEAKDARANHRSMTDYDQTDIPAGYDRARDHGPEVLDLWMHTIATHLEGHSISHILDLGCGTGRFSEALAARFNAEVIGLDPSQKM